MKNIFKVTSTNLRWAHILCRLLLVALLFVVDFTATNIAAAFLLYLVYFTVAQSIMLHRYYSHRMFDFRFSIVKWIFVVITLMSLRGSPIGWAYIHRLHHESTDNEQDPHSPHYKKFNILELNDSKNVSDNISPFKIKNILTKENLRLNDQYWIYALAVPLLFLAIDVDLFYFAWLLPVCFFQLCTTFFNYANHMSIPGSYRNFEDGNVGKSVNNYLLWLLSMGEAWHNNHHRWPGNVNFGIKTWEVDPSYAVIRLVQK